MKKRKPNNMRARVERSCRALLRTNHTCIVNIDPSGKQSLFNVANSRRIISHQIGSAIFEIAHRWTIYISCMCIDQAGAEYCKSVEVSPAGVHLASNISDVIEHFYVELRDSCNAQHLAASGWIAIPYETSLEEKQAAQLFEAAGAWNQRKAA